MKSPAELRAERSHPHFRKALAGENEKASVMLAEVLPLPAAPFEMRAKPVRAWRSRFFLVVLYDDQLCQRLTINRTCLDKRGDWQENISWDNLMQIKREVGMADRWAVECFPPDSAVVNEANMRHLWLLSEPPPYGWKPT